MDNKNVNAKNNTENNAIEDSALMADMATWSSKNKELNTYSEQIELAGYFPSLEERCISMNKNGLNPIAGVNTGALNGDVLYESGMNFLSSIKKELFDAKPEWEKNWIKESKIGESRLDENEEIDNITPRDGRPKLTVEYLRSIGYDIDIS